MERARAAGVVPFELLSILSFARAVLASPGEPAYEGAAQALERAMDLVRETGSLWAEPLLRLELAELARRRDDEPRRERELREAQRLFTEMGASGHVAKMAGKLAPLGS
jgi:hypothetical protein